jgi:hypothetical protein
MLDHLRESDVVVSVQTRPLIALAQGSALPPGEKINAATANFGSLTEAVDTSGPAGA